MNYIPLPLVHRLREPYKGQWALPYPFVCHAEVNAILNAITRDLTGCRMYVALFPCNECTKIIIQSGIGEIIYLSDKYAATDSVRASKIMLDSSGTAYRQFVPSRPSLTIDFFTCRLHHD